MARKNLLAGLTGEKLTAVNSETSSMAGDLAKAITTPFANFTGGRDIGAVSRSIEQIKQQAVTEIDPALIDPSPIADRLPVPLEALQDRAVEALDTVDGEIEQLIRNAWGGPNGAHESPRGLTGEKLTAVNSETSSMAGDLAKAITTPFANFTGGRAIGAVSRSIEQIKQQAVIEIDPALIDPSPIADRLPVPLEAVQDRAVEALDAVDGEIEQLIRNAWGGRNGPHESPRGLTGEKLTAVNSETSRMAGD